MSTLNDEQITEAIGSLEGWEHEGDSITKSFDRGDFVGSVEFIRSLVEPAEEMGHHPDLAISWSDVKVTLTSHSEGGLTDADFELAGKIDALA